MSSTMDHADRGAASARPTPLGIYDRQEPPGLTRFEVVALALSVLWLLLVAFYLVLGRTTGDLVQIRFIVACLAVILPIGLIWVAAAALRAAHAVQLESQRLQTAIDGLRHAYLEQSHGHATGEESSSVARKLDEIAAATRKTETTLAMFTSRRETAAAAPSQPKSPETTPAEVQPALALGARPEDMTPPLEADDFLRALNFPQTADDEAGFAALRRAMRDRPSAQLIQAAQDALTLLSQDGIYMDDLVPDRARAEIWRQFGQGVRGRAIAPLGGIRDRTALALAARRMKQDPIFRDTAHHFLRLFDKTFAKFEKVATDAEIQMLAETRTARAFMLLGRVAGTFD